MKLPIITRKEHESAQANLAMDLNYLHGQIAWLKRENTISALQHVLIGCAVIYALVQLKRVQ